MKFFKILSLIIFFSVFLHSSEEVPTQEEVAKLYVATFNRAPDSAGLDYWTEESGLTLSGIAQSFFEQDETKALYPDGTSNIDFIDSVYRNLFNRAPDTDGLVYWEEQLNTGVFSKNRFIEAIINGAQDNETSLDATILNNKKEVGLYFSAQGLIDKGEARNVMTGVTSSTTTVSFIKTKIDARELSLIAWDDFVEEDISAIISSSFSTLNEDTFKSIVDTAFASKINKAGMSVAVFNGSSVWKYSTGNASESVAMSEQTPVQLFSITKTMTSAEILKLVEEGSLSLSDTISTALSGHPDLSSFDSTKINLDATVEQLLTHTSGIKEYDSNGAGITTLAFSLMFGNQWKPFSLVNLVEENFSDVGVFSYSSTNFILLGMIAEYKTGADLNELFKNDFFTKLGISGTLLPQETIPSTLAEPYDDMSIQGGNAEFGNLLSVQPFFYTALSLITWASSGVSMTAEDVSKWGYGLYSDNGKAISSTYRSVLLNSIVDDVSNYGYGITRVNMELNGNTVSIYGHGGGGDGYLTIVYYSPDTDLSIAVLVNSNNKTLNPNIDTFDGGDLFNICVSLFNSYSK